VSCGSYSNTVSGFAHKFYPPQLCPAQATHHCCLSRYRIWTRHHRPRLDPHRLARLSGAPTICAYARGGNGPPKLGTTSESSSEPAAAGLALPGRSRAQKRIVWSFEAETRRCPSRWNIRARTLSRVPGRALHAERFAGNAGRKPERVRTCECHA
jgi:hypothetical protein